MKTLLATLCFLLLASLACAQYDERQILSQQAFQMLAQRQFSEAEKLFLNVLDKYPDDLNSVLQLMNLYFQTSQLEKAADTLERYRRILPSNNQSELQIQLLVQQGKPEEAWRLGQSYLQAQNNNEGAYRLLASYFERRSFYDKVLQLYQEGRKNRANPTLFGLEIANAALNYRQFDLALREYLDYLDKNPANLYFVNNQCKAILAEDPTRIEVIGDYATRSQNSVIKELYANALLSQKQFQSALEVYKNLPEKLQRFAEEQYKEMNDEVALPAFAWLADTSVDAFTRNDYRLRQAYIHNRSGRLEESVQLLRQIIADSLMLERANKLRRGVNLNARKLMAENVLALDQDVRAAHNWYQEARQFCNSSLDTQELDLALVRLFQIDQDYSMAARLLDQVTEAELAPRRDYLRFNNELLRGNTELADTLMNELVIHYPDAVYINDAIYLMMFTLSLEGADRDGFFSALRLMQLRDSAAVDSLQALFARNEDEELLLLAVEWALLITDKDKAAEILSRDWQDPICAEYAALMKLLLTQETDAELRLAREFLKSNPDSIFAPMFRQNLGRTNYSRPQF